MMFTESQLKRILPNMPNVSVWHKELIDELPKYDINNEKRIAGFLAQCGHESAEFRRLEENLNYSAASLNRVFGKYFGSKRNAHSYARNPQKIANVVYANRMGNGGTRSGDGWKYRGRGIIQLTGKNNYTAFGKTVGMTPEEVIDYVQTVEGAIKAACWFWSENNLNHYADRNDIMNMTRRINGGTNGIKHRRVLWERAKRVLGAEESSGSAKFYRVITNGDIGDDVAVIQKIVGVKADRIYGPNTKRAVRAWQRKHGLNPDGVVGPNTLKAMNLI